VFFYSLIPTKLYSHTYYIALLPYYIFVYKIPSLVLSVFGRVIGRLLTLLGGVFANVNNKYKRNFAAKPPCIMKPQFSRNQNQHTILWVYNYLKFFCASGFHLEFFYTSMCVLVKTPPRHNHLLYKPVMISNLNNTPSQV
jgi:hypothetical protein